MSDLKLYGTGRRKRSIARVFLKSGSGKIINSDFLNDLDISEAKKTIIKEVEKKKIGQKKTLFRLKDWGISR